MIVALIVSGAVVWILMLLPGSLDWIPLIEGAAVGIFLFYQGQSFNLSRFYLLATLAAAVGVGLSVAGSDGVYFESHMNTIAIRTDNLTRDFSTVRAVDKLVTSLLVIDVILILAAMARFKRDRLILD
jgi:hypothetical protein